MTKKANDSRLRVKTLCSEPFLVYDTIKEWAHLAPLGGEVSGGHNALMRNDSVQNKWLHCDNTKLTLEPGTIELVAINH